eukprot:comp20311_c1_seq1/m.25525 comp20311_c1_seq1/g.25525  ORF comp20311_c1_seq1/g.25525 comp20311_c1_seq1/m.25525 type:complete len:276 (-) comp20311_c1_seq1:361-1188(-)
MAAVWHLTGAAQTTKLLLLLFCTLVILHRGLPALPGRVARAFGLAQKPVALGPQVLTAVWDGEPPVGDDVTIQLPCGRPFRMWGHNLKGANIATEFSEDVYKICDTPVQDGDTIVDIGGNIGTFAIAALLQHPGVRVLSVEPLAENRRYLMYNAVANGVANRLAILPHGITADGRTLWISYDESNPANSRASQSGQGVAVPTRSLSAVIEMAESRVALLKIDCEGCEREVMLSTPALADMSRVGRVVGETHKVQSERLACFLRYMSKGARTFNCP